MGGESDNGRDDRRAAETVSVTDPNASRWRPDPDHPLPEQHEKGDRIGRYVVVEPLGAGGMGVVYKAHDPELDRSIALKFLLVRPGAEESQSTAHDRLLREAQALAQLAHPNVVAVFDVGTFEEKVFIAMELVEGQNVRDWLATEKRSVREIVGVYLAAGKGLAAAHAAGLVHRDFKPSNVVIGEDGRVRVLDFGLARAEGTQEAVPSLDVSLESGSSKRLHAQVTETGSVLGTPRYMAPEQFRGSALDARSDQFSFCVSLWEVLHGEWPFERREGEQFFDALSVGRLKPPRQARTPRYVQRILERGLSVDPEARYPSMDALLEELARDPAVVRRRIAGVAALIATLIGIGIAIVVPMRQQCAGFETKLEGVWDGEVEQAVQAAFVASGRPYAEDTFGRVEKILDGYAAAWVAMQTEACEATRVRGEQSDRMLDLRTACLRRRLGQLEAMTTLFAGSQEASVVDKAVGAASSLPTLERCADEQALEQAVPPPEDPEARARVDRLQARLDEAEVLEKAGQYPRGLEVATEVAEVTEELDYLPLRARALYRLGSLQERAGEAKRAEQTLHEAVQAGAAAREEEVVADAWIELIRVVGYRQSRHADGLSLRPAAEAAVARSGKSPRKQASLLNAVGGILYAQSKYDEAYRLHERALGIWEKALGSDDPLVADSLNNMAIVRHEQGKLDEARGLHERALAIREKALGPNHPAVGMSLSNLGNVLLAQGRYDDASARHERALALREKVLGPDHPDVATTLNNLGSALQEQGKLDEARLLLERSLVIWEKASGPDHPDTAYALGNLAIVLQKQGKLDEARALDERTLAIFEKSLGTDHPMVAIALNLLGSVLSDQGRHDRARALHERALGVAEKALGPTHPIVAETLVALGRCDLARGRAASAIPALERALRLREAEAGTPKEAADARFTLARALWEAKRDQARALELAEQAKQAYGSAGSAAKKELTDVEAWLQNRQ